MRIPAFLELAATPEAPLDQLALAVAAEFREVDAPAALESLDAFGAELLESGAAEAASAEEVMRACGEVLGGRLGFIGDSEHYDHPNNSMLDLVLSRRRGLPILLSVVYVEVARRAGIPLAGVGLPGHFVVGHFGADPPILVDAFGGGQIVEPNVRAELIEPWSSHDIAMRMLNNLVGAFQRRGQLVLSIHAARLRLQLPASPALIATNRAELLALEALLN